MEGNIFQGNTAQNGAGGLNLVGCQAILTNNLFSDNTIVGTGSGLQLLATTATLIHNTFAHNLGGAVSGLRLATHVDAGSSSANLVNNLFAGENVGVYAEANNVATLDGTLWGDGTWANASDWAGPGSVTNGAITLWGDPLFRDPNNLDYHLRGGRW